jgi:hypothetical protein
VTASEWRRFLESWSREWLDRLDEAELGNVPAEAIERQWLGRDPATTEAIEAAESRLGLRFPPSYRTFLTVSDGWGPTSPFIDRLLPVDEVERFAVLNPDWVDAYGGSDELRALIQVSDVGDSAVLLLNPSLVSADGEWEAWFFATWSADEERHRSFAELMRAQHATFEQLVERRPPSAKQLDAEVKRARSAALAGSVEAPLATLADAAGRGHRTARILLVQLLAFLNRWDELIPHVEAVLTAPWEGPGNAFWEDLCPALVRAAKETGRWRDAGRAINGSPDPKVAEGHRRYGGRLMEEMRKHGGIDCHFPDFPNEPFEASVQRAKSLARQGRADDAWSHLIEAIPRWISIRLDQLAPTELIADRDLGPIITPERGHAILATPRDLRDT